MTLLIGFDSAWTAQKRGAIVGVVRTVEGGYRELGQPETASFSEAGSIISEWRINEKPGATMILIDQPTIVANASGHRPVDRLVASPICRRYGGVQPANTGRRDMFGGQAPVWRFLDMFGGAADPLRPGGSIRVFETYPVLTMMALGWILPDSRASGRLPKYNPTRRKTFSIGDWRHVCQLLWQEYAGRNLSGLAGWLAEMKAKEAPGKADQDRLDACFCLLVALNLAESRACLMIGNAETGFIIVPQGDGLQRELEKRCRDTGREAGSWVRSFTFHGLAGVPLDRKHSRALPQ